MASWERTGEVGGETLEAGVERGSNFGARARVVGRKKVRMRVREEREKSIVSARYRLFVSKRGAIRTWNLRSCGVNKETYRGGLYTGGALLPPARVEPVTD
jgi:ribosomal protein L37AE/L43A